MEVKERVHVMPVGYENDRVVLPAQRLRADHVVLLAYTDETDHPSYVGTIRERLDEAGIEHETVPCDIFDFYDSIGTVAEVATTFADEDVHVNLASGSKVTAIGGMIACMATGATPYYVRAERYAAESEGDVAEGVRELTELPTYPMESPDRQHVAVLDYLDQVGDVRKRDLIEYAHEAGLPVFREREPANRKSEYRLLDSNVLDPLREAGYVTVRERGRSKVVELTDTGRDTLRAFSYRLEESPDGASTT
jgi:DNA-binding transcriptional ArsR family regulator